MWAARLPPLKKGGKEAGPRLSRASGTELASARPLLQAVKDFKGGKVEYRADKAGNVHIGFGKASFKAEDLLQNLKAVQVGGGGAAARWGRTSPLWSAPCSRVGAVPCRAMNAE